MVSLKRWATERVWGGEKKSTTTSGDDTTNTISPPAAANQSSATSTTTPIIASSTSSSALSSKESEPSSSTWTSYWDYTKNWPGMSSTNGTESIFTNMIPSSIYGYTFRKSSTTEDAPSPLPTTTAAKPSWLGLMAERMSTSKKAIGGDGTQPTIRRLGSGLGGVPGSSSSNMLSWMINNPYNSVRGRQHGHHRQSMYAVRSFINVASVEEEEQGDSDAEMLDRRTNMALAAISSPNDMDEDEAAALLSGSVEDLSGAGRPPSSSSSGSKHNSLTACHVAEGTIRALRDLLLDEAVELNAALRFWSDRWERPLLSWLETGPLVWASAEGYNHRSVGNQVAQIQAVLARRCAAIGELQEHLLRAGWQRGVAQWGVLGQGGQWAPVAPGIDGSMAADEQQQQQQQQQQIPSSLEDDSESPDLDDAIRMDGSQMSASDARTPRRDSRAAAANVVVRKRDGGGIFIDDPSFLAQWSVEAILLVRKQLRRAGNGLIAIPYDTNWTDTVTDTADASALSSNDAATDDSPAEVLITPAEAPSQRMLPLWACEVPSPNKTESDQSKDDGTGLERASGGNSSSANLTITDLPLMMDEVTQLLNIMEDVVAVQRCRRLERLRPPSWLRRNWYSVVTGIPVCFWLVYKGYTTDLIRRGIRHVKIFFRERLHDPLVAIFEHIWKGRESFSDEKNRKEVMDILVKMIKAWLDENYPDMPESERQAMAAAMDVSLIERKKEESMKTFYEINNVIRMSFIEMEYMKKEMMNALNAMDEVISANDINMNIAAITPVVILTYINSKVFKYLSYAVLKLGSSREETYASIRNVVTDMERLLVMRDNPPGGQLPQQGVSSSSERICVLGPDDLGMLMLLIHDCRTILWSNRRRFTAALIRGISEDLAELAGERGAVSVRQQLQIISRMTRTYPFLKVISTGNLYQYSPLRLG